MRTAAGAIARRYLAARLGVRIYGYLSQVGPLSIQAVDPAFAYQNPFFCPDPSRLAELEELIWKVRAEGDSIGARVPVVARHVPSTQQPAGAAPRRRGQPARGRHHRPARPLRRTAGHADRRGQARHSADGPLPAAPRAERGREVTDSGYHRSVPPLTAA